MHRLGNLSPRANLGSSVFAWLVGRGLARTLCDLRNRAHPSVGRPAWISPVARTSEETPRCEDCYFRQKKLCALQVEEPCSSFRPERPEGLVPPRQPVLLLRPPRWVSDGRMAPSGELRS